jgi:exonuclease SbcC
LRETQAAIEQLLRMNYDTFTNASFLLQGKADQFTTRTPNQRKEILAELLGVTDWERYREAAAEARKVEQGKLSMLEGRLEDIQSELAQEPERKSALHEAQNQRLFFVEKLKLQEQLLNQMRQTAAAVEQQKILVKNLSGTVDRIQRNLTASRNTATERRQEKETNDVILADSASITADYAAWQSADAALQSWQEKANSYNQLLQQKNPAEMEVAQERSRLGQQQKQLEERAQQVRKAQNEHPKLQETVRKGEAHLAELSSMLTELDRTQQRSENVASGSRN